MISFKKVLFCQNIIPFDWVMNVSLSWVMFSVKKMLLPAKTAVSTKYNLSKSFHEQNFLRNAIFSVLISGVKLLLIHNWLKKCWWIAGYIFSILYNLTHFSLPLNPAINRWQNGQRTKYCVLDEKNKKSLKPNFYFIASFPKFR